MRTKAFWLDVIERAGKTAAQVLLSALGADQLNLLSVAWLPVLGVAGGAALLSLLTSIVSAPVGEPGTASLVPAGSGRHARTEEQP